MQATSTQKFVIAADKAMALGAKFYVCRTVSGVVEKCPVIYMGVDGSAILVEYRTSVEIQVTRASQVDLQLIVQQTVHQMAAIKASQKAGIQS